MQMTKSEADQEKLGVGLDIGTMNLIAARHVDGKLALRKVRDAFLDLEAGAQKTLKLSNVSYVPDPDDDNTLIVFGDSALTMANLFKRDVRRPLSAGVIAAGELDAQKILGILIHHVIEEPMQEGEHCYYSVPAAPLDDLSQDIVYHTEIFRRILRERGYTPHPMNEAMAIVYSQCAAEQFSGLTLSFGAGMMNVALAYQTMKGLDFSLARSGDWVDQHAAKAIGATASRMCSVKEQGVNLAKPTSREEEALVLYIRALIRYCLENVVNQFRRQQASISLPGPVPLVLSGGTAKAGGFLEVFQEEFFAIKKRSFPFQISEIRMARDPLTAVAEGLLVLAGEEYAEG
jgi:hypothetical protein